jgi:beta-glucosidase
MNNTPNPVASDGTVTIPPPDPDDFLFPAGFFWGTQTAPTQVEGGGSGDEGRIDNEFSEMAEMDPSSIADGSSPNQGPDHWNRVDEDYSLLGSMGQNAHAFGIDWARIQPTKDGPYDAVAMQHYIDEIETCKANGMEPMVTLFHFALPKWLAAEGGLTNPHVADYFADFTRYVAKAVGNRVTWWTTMNEPNTVSGMKYFDATWPPREFSVLKFGKAYVNLLKMHARAASELRAAAPPGHVPKVGIAHTMRPTRPDRRWNPLDHGVSMSNNAFVSHWFLQCLATGRARPPFGRGQKVKGLKDSLDFMGLNYYSRERMHFSLKGFNDIQGFQKLDPEKPITTFNWNVDPDGLAETTFDIAKRFRGLPIMITENGVADNNDELRPRFLIDHLAVAHHLIDLGVPLIGYIHWTNWRNWEWAQGFTTDFGLYGYDPVTKARWVKPSGRIYKAICEGNRLPAAWMSNLNRHSPIGRDLHSAKELLGAVLRGAVGKGGGAGLG